MNAIVRVVEHRLLLSILLILAIPVVVLGGLKAWNSTSNDVLEWMPDDFQATRDLGEFVQHFQSDELMMISWEGQRADSPEVETLTQLLLAAEKGPPLFRRVITAKEMLEFLAARPLQLSRSEALCRTEGWLTDGTGEQCGMLALVSAAGASNRHAALQHVHEAANHTPGLKGVRLRIAGPSVESVSIDRASQEGLMQLNLASFGICLVLLAILLRTIRGTLLIFSLALFNEVLCLAIIWYSGAKMDSVLLLSANLTFVLSISIGVHLLNYYFDAQETHPLEESPRIAILAACRPTFYSVLTTALGLLSLSINSLRPLSKFGIYSAISLVLAAIVMMIYVPLHLKLWPLKKRPRKSIKTEGTHSLEPRGSRRIALVISLVGIFATLFGLVGAKQIKTSIGITELLPANAEIIQDYHWIEERIGPLIPIEIVVTAPAGEGRTMLAQYRAIQTIHAAISKRLPETHPVSAVNFAGVPPEKERGFRFTVQLAAFRNALSQSEKRLADMGFIRDDGETRRWRISLRTSLFKNENYGDLLDTVQALVDEKLSEAKLSDTTDVLIAGGVPLVYQAQQKVLDDLLKSFSLAFVLVALALMVLFRSVSQALIAMVPNLFPVAVVFGVMGWFGITAEVGTLLTASAALGIAVDDTLHFLTWRQAAIRQEQTPWNAMLYAYRRCALAMTETTLVCGLGLAVFMASGFTPIARFGICMGILLALALLSDLVLLPALLLSPLGAVFRKPRKSMLHSEQGELL